MLGTGTIAPTILLNDFDYSVLTFNSNGKEMVHQLYGTRVTILARDFMLAQSSWYLSNLENLEVIKLISQLVPREPPFSVDLIVVYQSKCMNMKRILAYHSKMLMILDFTQSAEQLGKPSGSDLTKGNLTAPLISVLQMEPKLRDIIKFEFCETGSLNEAIELVKQCGGIEREQELAKEKANIAIKSLQCLPQSDFRLGLEDMVMFNLERIA
ncbi:hypothetical protein PVK06_019937 [Gossypium arboreum]|uniref:Uncharacterized protein n=1 Tax=Gossypium arboreum TaxID=29729 RepID=A0ABR0PLA7_GOSAR|nr:hypothetical protein PVK06_019937 [Gossypium arboreum]